MEAKMADKNIPALSKCRNLIWVLLIQALFNDKKCEEYQNLYGEYVTRGSEFGHLLKSFSCGKIRIILTKIFNEDDCKERIGEEKYDCLRSPKIFRDCMEIAEEEYDWETIPL